MLRAFRQPFATCCDMLQHVRYRWLKVENGQIFHATFVDVAWCCSRLARFVQQCCARVCTLVRFSIPNMSQHVATGWPNASNMLPPTMLRYVAFKCCDRLAGACKYWANNVGICCADRLTRASQLILKVLTISCLEIFIPFPFNSKVLLFWIECPVPTILTKWREICGNLRLRLCLCLRQGRFHVEIRNIVLALVLASLVKTRFKTECQSFFPPLSYLPFLALFSLFFLFSSLGVILRPRGVVKSKCIWVIWFKVLTWFS